MHSFIHLQRKEQSQVRWFVGMQRWLLGADFLLLSLERTVNALDQLFSFTSRGVSDSTKPPESCSLALQPDVVFRGIRQTGPVSAASERTDLRKMERCYMGVHSLF